MITAVALGPAVLPRAGPVFAFLPGGKLTKGPNVVTACGGGVDFFAENDTITLGANTLAACLVK